MDVLTDVLQTVRVSSACYGRVELTAPWGLRVQPGQDALFHVVLQGDCWLQVDGVEQSQRLSSGDVVALPHGHGHTLSDQLQTRAVPMSQLLAAEGVRCNGVVRHGGGGASSVLVCGTFRFEDRHNNPLLAMLPPVLRIASSESRSIHWLEPTLQFIACEAASERPGSQTVISRLADVLFIQVVRAHLASVTHESGGWLRALTEPQIGAALGSIHQAPGQAWTVAALASKVGMSRSAFAARFTRLVGEPPLQYITRWRMQKAAGLLRAAQRTLAQVAAEVGYESEAAFSKAFKRWAGMAPGAYRRAARSPSFRAAA